MNEPPRLVFVGGTGRSGTHIIAELLGCHSHYRDVPIEARFHTNPRGFPDLLEGRATPQEFLHKLRTFWWHRIKAGEFAPALLPRLPMGREVRGLHKIMPRERFDQAVERFEAAHEKDLPAACRRLFLDLLWPLAEEAGKPGLVEMSTDSVAQGPTLTRLFGEAKLVLTVRDGRDTGVSKVSLRQKREHPRDPFEGVDWWLERMLGIERGLRDTPPDRVLLISLDELVHDDRDATYERMLHFLGIEDQEAMREFFETTMNAENAHRERWRVGLSEDRQRELVAHYEQALDRLDAEGSRCLPLLRRAFERHG